LKHPNLTADMVEQLHAAGDQALRQKIAYASGENPELQVALIRRGDASDRLHLSSNKSLSHEAMLVLAGDSEKQVRSNLARHPRLTPAAMRQLLAQSSANDSYDCNTRATIAFHQNTPPDLRLELLRSELVRYLAERDEPFRGRLAYTRLRFSRRFAAYTSSGLLLGLLLRPEMPIDLFEPMLTHPEPAIEQAFLDRTDLPESWRAGLRRRVIERSLRAGSLIARLCALSAPDCPLAELAQRAREGRWLERYAAALNPATPPNIVAALGEDANVLVQAAASRRESPQSSPQ
jgi:hypothetical protein